MIDVNEYEIFRDNMAKLKETSFDDTNCEYMTECERPVINFDEVVKSYCGKLHKPYFDSNDALLIGDDGKSVTMIEFKNGFINARKQFELKKKIYDSMLIFNDITGENISSTREFVDYILVYNETKNSDDAKTEYRESRSRDEIDRTLLGYGREVHIKYGLEVFKGYCFRNVNTYTKREFESRFVNGL